MDQYSNMAPRLSGQTSKFGVVFFVSKSLLGIERQKKASEPCRILIYRTWPIRVRARAFYEQIVNEAKPSRLSLVENEGE